MRVLHVNKFLYRRGGAEGYLFDVARLQERAGDVVEFFGMAHVDNDRGLTYAGDFPSQVDLEPPPPGLRGRAAAAARMIWSTSARDGLRRVLADFRPDVVHMHNVYHQLSPSVVAACRDAGVPCVMTLHDYKLACPSYQMLDRGEPCDACVTGGPLQAARRSCKDGSRSASTLLAVESWLHRKLRAYAGIGVFIAPSEFLAGVSPTRWETPDSLVRQAATLVGCDLPVSWVNEYLRGLRDSSLDEVNAALRAHVRPDELVVVAVGAADQITGPLERLGFGTPEVLPA